MPCPTTDRGGVTQVVQALVADGWRLELVDDGDENITRTPVSAIDAIMAVDDSRLYVSRHRDDDHAYGWVRFVLGNSPEEVVCDFTTNLEVVDALTSSWDA